MVNQETDTTVTRITLIDLNIEYIFVGRGVFAWVADVGVHGHVGSVSTEHDLRYALPRDHLDNFLTQLDASGRDYEITVE